MTSISATSDAMPFKITEQLSEQRRTQERIENAVAQTDAARDHSIAHRRSQALEEQRAALLQSYDRLGQAKAVRQQGQILDIEV